MYYITAKLPPSHHQMTLEEFLFQENAYTGVIARNETSTRTFTVKEINSMMRRAVNADELVKTLIWFNEMTDSLGLREVPGESLYRTFKIPKKSGGWRTINAPNEQLMSALRTLKGILEKNFFADSLYHTTAFAYIHKRGIVDCDKRHTQNESRWYAKFDVHDFFGSTTLDFVMNMFSMIYPFCMVTETESGKAQLRKALELGFLNGGLPQGTPLSPLITNIMMIPIDHALTRGFREFGMVNTRYADDFIVSSKYNFNFENVEHFIIETFEKFDAPFNLNTKKTRYGSSAGSNWNLGLMLTADNRITVGHEKKRIFKAKLSAFCLDTINGNPWSVAEVQKLEGLRNYYRMVEGDGINKIVAHVGNKYNMHIVREIKKQLRGAD